MKRLLSSISALTAILLSACDWEGRGGEESPITPNIRTLQAYEVEMVSTSGRFAIDLFRQLEKAGEVNAFYSPYSIHQALSMTMNGNEGDVLEEFLRVLQFDGLDTEQANKASKELTQFLLDVDPKVKVAIANAIWYKQGYDVNPVFKQESIDYYGAEVAALDMVNPQSLNIINGWISNKTEGIIQDMLDFIPANTVMYLVNAIYFKGDWKYEFPASGTKKAPFYPSRNNSVEVDMMELDAPGSFRYYASDRMRYLEIPYSTGQYSMGVLSGIDHNLDEVLADFSYEKLESWREQAMEANFILKMPKFKMKHKLPNMGEDLMEMGLVKPFDFHPDNFTRLFTNPTDDLKISRVIHDAFIEVDEKGTEAAAATVVEVIERVSSGPSTPWVLTLDQPFVFIIQEKHSGAILFIGKMGNPAILD